jgi:hypothetical protein
MQDQAASRGPYKDATVCVVVKEVAVKKVAVEPAAVEAVAVVESATAVEPTAVHLSVGSSDAAKKRECRDICDRECFHRRRSHNMNSFAFLFIL